MCVKQGKQKIHNYEEIENNQKKCFEIYKSLAIKTVSLPNLRAIGRTQEKEIEITFIGCNYMPGMESGSFMRCLVVNFLNIP